MASYDMDRKMGEMRLGSERSTAPPLQHAGIVAQEIPEDIKHQRRLLKDFYATWRKYKFVPPAGTVDEDEFTITPIKKYVTDIGLKDCEELCSTADHLASAYSQLASVFLLCANAYPKHAPTCYTLAESCFNMARISSRLLSASWKLNHGFTMSVLINGLDEVRYYLLELMSAINTPIFWYFQLYSDLVESVRTNKSFETGEEFQKGYEHLPAESQVSAFASMLGEAEAMLKEAFGQIRQLGKPEGDRPKQEEVSASSSARDESQMTLQEFEESGIYKKICEVKGLIRSFAGDMKAFCELLKSLKISEC
jgi:hypothetical protein